MSNPRHAAYTQTAKQTTAEVVADLGNHIIMLYCSLPDIKPPINDIAYWWSTAQRNIKVIRLIQEGRENPEFVSSLLVKEIRKCLSEHGAAFESYKEERKRVKVVVPDGKYYTQHGRYKSPIIEYARLYDVVYSSLYVLANIDRLDPVLMDDWFREPRRRSYDCKDMNIWLIDRYYQQADARATEHGRQHAALTRGLTISGARDKRSQWNALWEHDHFLLRARNVDVSDLQTIEVLDIPRELSIPSQTKDQVLANFMRDAEQRRP